ncbi:DUF1376 domain-containing protein [Dechloromonas sp. CZR5]|uniref:DUF1376 domain-containing protein n=1 Tax=Dechloromonas sp. CZR5 TaxID=2608630 RepID=UPI001CC5E379|nr:DUF1376 domain-containing protein [Dechloromonas sp. CZR5]
MTTEPLTPSGCDLRGFPFMPLDVVRLRDSDIAAISSGDEFRCAVLLWCASWHQIPAASLPDDDIILAQLAGFGRVVKEWKKVREGSLRGWVKCSDGRLYHPVVAEKANEAWARKLEQAWNTECARIKKINQRHELTGDSAIPYPTIEQYLSPNYEPPKAPFKTTASPGTKKECPEGQGADVPDTSLGKRNPIDRDSGQRQGQGELSKQSSPELQPLEGQLEPDVTNIPDPPRAESQWMIWFNRVAGTSFDAGSRFDRESLWPIFRRWCDSGITQQQMRDALTKAHAEATEPIACLPKYVDRVLANSQAPKRQSVQRQSPGQKTAEAAERWLASQGVTP